MPTLVKSPRDRIRILAAGLCAVLAFVVAFVAVRSRWMAYSFGGQAFCIGVAVVWMLALQALAVRPRAHRPRGRSRFLLGAATLVPAFLLRGYLLRSLPPRGQAGLEEMFCGVYSYQVFEGRELLPKWRFSSALGALGWKVAGEFSLEALRVPSIVLGYAGLLFLYLCLVTLRVGAWVALVAVACMASLKFVLYATGGSMWFNYFGVSLLPLLFLFLLRADGEDDNRPVWACLAGMLSGVFVYEYASFQLFAAFSGCWILWRALRRRDRTNTFLVLSSFFVGFVLLLTPLLCHIGNVELTSYIRHDLLESFFKYRAERKGLIAPHFLQNLTACFELLFGRLGGGEPFLETPDHPQILPAVGAVFFVSLVAAFFRPRKRPFAFALACVIVLGATITSAAKNIFTPCHVPGFVPSLIVLSAVWISDVDDRVRAAWAAFLRRRQKRPFPVLAWCRALAYAGTFVAVAVLDARDVRATMRSASVLQQFDNNEYVVCNHIATTVRSGQEVILISERELPCGPTFDSRWLGGGKKFTISDVPDLPDAGAVAPGTLVVQGSMSNEGIPEKRLAQFRALAAKLESCGSYQVSRSAFGKIRAASFCYRCSSSSRASSAIASPPRDAFSRPLGHGAGAVR